MITNTGVAKPIKKKLFGLDHLRTVAIIFVVIYHYGRIFPHPEWTNTISAFGWTGVDLFFVLSGYLIASQLFLKMAQQKKISFREFFLKRFFRIIPAYIAVVSLYFLFPSFREREALAPLWKYLTFTQNIGLDLRTQGTFSHAWSLCIEEQFYLFFPLILMGLVYFKAGKKGYWLLLLLFAAGFAARLYSWFVLVAPFAEQDEFWVYWQEWMYYPTWCRLDGLLVGVSVAALFQFKPALTRYLQQYGNHFLLVSLVTFSAGYFLSHDEKSFAASVVGFPLVDIGYGFVVAGAVSPSCFLYKLSSAITEKIAALSYAIYLVHKISIHITQVQFSRLHIAKESNLMFFICIITTAAAAILLNRVVEKPFLQLRDRILNKKKV